MSLKTVLGLIMLLSTAIAEDLYASTAQDVCRGDKYPPRCSCDSDLSVIDCRGSGLRSVPDTLPWTTQTLILSDNNITVLAPGSFKACGRLQYLDLSLNDISSVKDGAFESLGQLEVLLLFNNSLQPDDFSNATFGGLTSLKTLHIYNNKLSDHYDGQFLVKGCPNVETLGMDGLKNSTFGEEFSHLGRLLNLTLYGNLTYITNDTFKAFEGCPLTTLRIRSGLLASIQPFSFAHFKHLETLDLSFNQQLGLPNAAKSWYGLQFTNISSLILESVASYDDGIVIVDDPWFYEYLDLTRLKRLVLDGNNIVILDGHFHQYTPYLEHLSFAYNRLVQVYYLIKDLYWLQHLRSLDASYQNRALSQSQSRVSRSVQPERSNSQSFKTSVGRPAPVPTGPIFLYLPPNVEVINLAGSLTVDYETMVPTYLMGPNIIRYVSYAQNGIRRFKGPLVVSPPPPGPVVLDLSGNNCEELNAEFTKYVGNKIGELLFSDNRLGSQLAQDSDGVTFRNLTELTHLDLSLNDLKTLPKDVFLNQDNLQHLNLSHNSLRVISFRFSHMNKLSTLDLSGNLLNELDGDTRQLMDDIVRLGDQGNLTVDLSYNPLEISCNTLQFLEWVLKTPGVHLKNWKAYTGMYKNSLVSFSELQNVLLPQLRVECKSELWLKVAGSLLAVVIVVLALSVFLFRNRFEVKYLCLSVVINRKKYQALEQEDKDANFTYDAFIAFDQNDLPFVQDILEPTLEKDGAFHLCIHHRDFVSGPIEENILKALHDSRRTILLLSQHFVKSSWCRYELQMARLRCFDEGRDIIIPVVLDDLPVRSMNRTLRALLSKNTYIEWPGSQNEQDLENFWLKMRRALQKRSQRVVRCQCGRTMNTTDLV